MSRPDNVHTGEGTRGVFQRVAVRLETDEAARSLWLKLEQEMASGGVLSAASYVRTRFKELSDRVTAALSRGGQA